MTTETTSQDQDQDQNTLPIIVEPEHVPSSQNQSLKAQKKKAYKKRKKERERIERTKNIDSSSIMSANTLRSGAQAELERWDEMCNLIVDFKKQFNRMPSIRSGNKMETTVGRWIFLQKSRYKSGKLHEYHVNKLRSTGIL